MSLEMSVDYRHVNGAGMIAGRGTTTTKVKLPPGFEARHVVLQRQAWERVALVSASIAGFAIPPLFRRVGDSKVLDLPETNSRAARELALEWTNTTSRAYHLPYRVTEEPQGEVDQPLPAAMRALAPEPEPVLDTGPASELEETIAASFRVSVLKLRQIVGKLAQRYDLTVPDMLEFFGPDGYATVPPDVIGALSARAGQAGLNANEFVLASTFQGVAVTMGERRDLEQLMTETPATDPGAKRTEDFKVSVVVHDGPTVPGGEAPTVVDTPAARPREPAPRADGARLNELAHWFKVPPLWLVPAIAAIADARGQKPDELVQLLTLPMVMALRQMFVGLVGAPNDPIVLGAAKLGTEGIETSRDLKLNQSIASRCIDALAEAHRQGHF